MCTPDGMMFDDGVTLRLADDRYFMTTTTGGAAARPGLAGGVAADRVARARRALHLGHRAVDDHRRRRPAVARGGRQARAGPRREQRGVPVHDLPGDDARVGCPGPDLPDLLLRRAGLRDQRRRAGTASPCGSSLRRPAQDLGITPYGTETMHVLRAEKGYPIVGQDTDGTVTPQDAGMDWIVSKQKDFVGKRSYADPTPRAPTASTSSACCRSTGPQCCRRAPSCRGRHLDRRRAGAGADARPRHLQLPQRRPGAAVRAGAGHRRPGPDRRACCSRRSGTSWSRSR